MRKEFVLLALLAMIAFIGCKEHTANEQDWDECCSGYPEQDALDEDIVDEEVDIPDEEIVCKPYDVFFDDMPVEWKAFFTLKMSGIINDPENQDPDFAFLTKIGVTLLATQYNLGDNYGMYVRDTVQDVDGNTYPAVVAVGVGNLTWPVTNKLASLWAGQTFVLVDDLMSWREQSVLEGLGSVEVTGTYQVSVFETWIEINGSAQNTRMECVRGLSAWNSDKTAYDGAIFVCTCCNIEWAVGEQMAMMNYSKMIDDPVELLAVLNEGLTSEDPEYRTDVCRCWASDGVTPMDCEAMKDEFGIGELPDEDAIPSDDDALLTDEMPDEDALISD